MSKLIKNRSLPRPWSLKILFPTQLSFNAESLCKLDFPDSFTGLLAVPATAAHLYSEFSCTIRKDTSIVDLYLPFAVLLCFHCQSGHGVRSPALTTTRNRTNPEAGYNMPKSNHTTFKVKFSFDLKMQGSFSSHVVNVYQSTRKTYRNTTVSSSSLKSFPCCVSQHYG